MSEFREQPESVHDHARTPSVTGRRDAPEGDDAVRLASTLGNDHVGRVLKSPGLQRAGSTSAQHLEESVARAIEDRRGRGKPLDEDTRAEMEGSLGQDLSDVRVHTDSDAHALNESVSARAFTTGNDVFFKQGTYDPGSSSGKELLGHELTHVVQQREGTSGLGAGEVSHPSDAAEQHAEAVGQSIANQQPAPAAGSAPAGGIAREAMPEEEEELQMSREPGAAVSRAADREAEEEELA